MHNFENKIVGKYSNKEMQELKDYFEKNKHWLSKTETNIIKNILKIYEKRK